MGKKRIRASYTCTTRVKRGYKRGKNDKVRTNQRPHLVQNWHLDYLLPYYKILIRDGFLITDYNRKGARARGMSSKLLSFKPYNPSAPVPQFPENFFTAIYAPSDAVLKNRNEEWTQLFWLFVADYIRQFRLPLSAVPKTDLPVSMPENLDFLEDPDFFIDVKERTVPHITKKGRKRKTLP
jgi:hypothetical protein